MSEPAKKPGQQPEGYQPQKPEMMRALEEQDRAGEPGGPQRVLLAGGSQSSLTLSSAEIRVIRIPKMKMISSGPLTDEQVFAAFDNWWGKFDARDYITPRDFMQFNREKGCMEQLFAVPKGFRNRLKSRRRYKTVNFPGGLYAVGTAKDIHEDFPRVRQEIRDAIEKSDWFALSDSQNDLPERYELTHVITPKIFKEKCGYHLSDCWIPIIIKE